MSDREKVVKEYEDYVNSYISLTTSNDYELEMHKSVLALLKEQEPKPVVAENRRILLDDSYDDAKYFEDTFYHCPSCDRVLSRTHMKKDIRFCENCGQEVKWDV